MRGNIVYKIALIKLLINFKVVVFPNCKINLGLNIVSKRTDGYHNLETVFYPIAITDALEIITAEKSTIENSITFFSSGLIVDGDIENNLCVKAYHLLKKDFPQLPSVKMHLHKAIPMGAGLGGGSADAAFTLMLLNKKFELNLSKEQLINYALQLGSDCPFFIINKPCFATGRGEVVEEISLDRSAYKLVIVNPGIHINTGWAFEQIKPKQPKFSSKEIVLQPLQNWKGKLVNDFEVPALSYYPALKELKENLYKCGALYASMSGSGSSFYGIFEKNCKVLISHFPGNYLVKIIE